MTSYQEADAATDGGLKGFARYTSCLIPIIAALVLLALGVTAINYVINGEQGPNPAEASSDADARIDAGSADPAPTPEPPADPRRTFTTDGILAVFSGLGWTQFGELAHYELGSRQHQTRKFRKDGAHVAVTIYAFKSDRLAEREAKTLGPKSQRVRFDHKIVALEALNDAAKPQLADLIERLETYREMVRD